MSEFALTVYGLPAPQGSKRHVGRGILVESSKRCKPWREAVHWAAVESKVRVTGPVEVVMIFTVPKPRSAPKHRRTWPDRRPDLDKLQRSTLDALVGAGVIEDDARVVAIRAAKVFPNEYPDALDVPGARIRVEAVLDASPTPRRLEEVRRQRLAPLRRIINRDTSDEETRHAI